MIINKNIFKYYNGFCSKESVKRRFFAFTLAEVLITMVVIGIIAAITVPIMIASFQKNITTEKVKKVFSTLSQTTNKAIADYGNVSDWEMKSGNNRNSAKFFADTYMIPYLNILTICEDNSTDTCKFNNITQLNGNKYTFDTTNNSKAYRFYLADGTFISLVSYLNNTTTGHNKLVTISFDINGQNKPNKLGRDVFIIEYMVETFKYPEISGRMIPQYGNQTRSELIKNKSSMCNKKQSGEACLALIYKDGWDIKSDYPW